MLILTAKEHHIQDTVDDTAHNIKTKGKFAYNKIYVQSITRNCIIASMKLYSSFIFHAHSTDNIGKHIQIFQASVKPFYEKQFSFDLVIKFVELHLYMIHLQWTSKH